MGEHRHQNDHIQKSIKHLERLEGEGFVTYPYRYDRTHTIANTRSQFSESARTDPSDVMVKVAGRVMNIRRQGSIVFMDLKDESGEIQLGVQRDVSPETHRLANSITRGTIIGFEGRIFRTRSGELTILADSLEILTPCLLPLPDKKHGIKDVGTARSLRYLSLITDPELGRRLEVRSEIIRRTREFLWNREFLEMETPVLSGNYGGAEAKPFTAFCNALDEEQFLRISPEIDLKRLLVGMFFSIFEIGKQFRNESIDATHQPEFTSVEIYRAFDDYTDMMQLVEDLFEELLRGVVRSREVELEGKTIDLSPPFRRLRFFDAIRQYAGVDIERVCMSKSIPIADRLGVPTWDTDSAGIIATRVFDTFVEPHLVEPTFVLDYPAEVCPLTKRHRVDGHLAERFELFIGGVEYANAYSELNDPRQQRAHLEQQQRRRREMGDELAHPFDEDFIQSLEYGMPPAGGVGIGIDRLVMLLTRATHIQDVIPFPMRKS